VFVRPAFERQKAIGLRFHERHRRIGADHDDVRAVLQETARLSLHSGTFADDHNEAYAKVEERREGDGWA